MSLWIRILPLGVAALLLGGATEPPTPTFCARLAPKLNMKASPAGDGPVGSREWRLELFGLGAMLFGGSASVTFFVAPGATGTAGDFIAHRDACKPSKGKIRCDLEGPVQFNVGTKKGDISEEVLPGERAVVEMPGKSIICRDE